MPGIQEKILLQFYDKLQESSDFDDKIVTRVRALLSAKKKPKAADLVKALSAPPGERQQ